MNLYWLYTLTMPYTFINTCHLKHSKAQAKVRSLYYFDSASHFETQYQIKSELAQLFVGLHDHSICMYVCMIILCDIF